MWVKLLIRLSFLFPFLFMLEGLFVLLTLNVIVKVALYSRVINVKHVWLVTEIIWQQIIFGGCVRIASRDSSIASTTNVWDAWVERSWCLADILWHTRRHSLAAIRTIVNIDNIHYTRDRRKPWTHLNITNLCRRHSSTHMVWLQTCVLMRRRRRRTALVEVYTIVIYLFKMISPEARRKGVVGTCITAVGFLSVWLSFCMEFLSSLLTLTLLEGCFIVISQLLIVGETFWIE